MPLKMVFHLLDNVSEHYKRKNEAAGGTPDHIEKNSGSVSGAGCLNNMTDEQLIAAFGGKQNMKSVSAKR